jgi:hypothetical protein
MKQTNPAWTWIVPLAALAVLGAAIFAAYLFLTVVPQAAPASSA